MMNGRWGGLVLLVVLCGAVRAGATPTVVVDDNVLLGDGDWLSDYGLLVYQVSDQSDHTAVFVDYAGPQLTGVNSFVDEGSDLYVVHSGDWFTSETIAAGDFDPVVTIGPNLFSATVGYGDFYLGVRTGVGLPTALTVFGWVLLHPSFSAADGWQLSMVGNVMSYDSRGIVVGTTTTVPEPGALALLGVAGLCGWASRRR